MSRTERMKAAIAAKNQPPVVAPAPAAPSPIPLSPPVIEKATQPVTKKAPRPSAAPKVRRACGHQQGVKELETTPCLGCLNKSRRERCAARRAVKTSDGPLKPDRRPVGRDARESATRYPAGTQFVKGPSWDGVIWTARLAVPVAGLGLPLILEFQSTGVHKLLTGLWEAWQAYLDTAPAVPDSNI